MKRLIKYLKNKKLSLTINANKESVLTSYADANLEGKTTDRKSTSRTLFLFCSHTIQLVRKKKRKKKNSVMVSSADAEYSSAANLAQEIM